ncbi:ParM/StbA family protein [Cytobacillus sp. FSL M8-0252]|uniref:ParM/StbA family protein n=1 Tax=Cytobacillus sp. FSL M8-0252 TaxID=2921621 RepID=UPI0030F69562
MIDFRYIFDIIRVRKQIKKINKKIKIYEVNKMNLCCGIDIGNAKTEVAFMGNEKLNLVRQPSVVSQLLSKPETNDSDEKTLVTNLLDNLAVHIFSDALKKDGIYFVGRKALDTPRNIKNMNITLGNKVKQDIPIITSLSLLAGVAIQKHYETKETLPKTLTLNVKMATAIPSSEYTKDSAKFLEDRFLGEHNIKVFVGSNSVVVNVNVTHCKCTEEGKTAMLAFLKSENDILSNYNDTYNENAKPIDFAKARSLHSDIGDGTSEIIFTQGFNPVPNGSYGVRVGVGHATNEAIKLYRNELGGLIGDITRQHFIELLTGDTEKSKVAREKMTEATYIQGYKINEHIQQAFVEYTASTAEYFFVHGGGSIVFKKDMYEDLIDFTSQVRARVVWIPEEYATSMNSRGTFYLAQQLFCKE